MSVSSMMHKEFSEQRFKFSTYIGLTSNIGVDWWAFYKLRVCCHFIFGDLVNTVHTCVQS